MSPVNEDNVSIAPEHGIEKKEKILDTHCIRHGKKKEVITIGRKRVYNFLSIIRRDR